MSFRFTIIILFSVHFLMAQNSNIIISPIGQQTAYEESRVTVYFSTLKHFDAIDFTTTGLPAFGDITYDQTGNGQIVLDPGIGDEGTYSIDLIAQSGSLSNTISFNLDVKSIDKNAATIFYIDPQLGSDNASGTESDPFKTLTDFLITKNALLDDNSYVFLKSGFHGSPVFVGTRDKPVKILAAAGHIPRVKKLNFSFTQNWYISGLDISPQNEEKSDNETLINIFAGSKFIEITNSNIYAIDDASVWTTNEMWYAGSGNGILSSGTECLFRNNYFKNTWFTVEMRKQYNEFSYNIINWFGADAVRTIASNQTVSFNQIKNATVYDYDHPTRPQHDDAIQSWTFNNPVKNNKIIGNQIADIADPNLPLPTEIMQGIADFDGYAEDWEVTNNLVITHHAHGIALYGAKNCNISNNTVTRNPFNLYFQNFKPWIRLNPRKVDVGNDPSFGNLVRNNIMSTFQDENLEPATIDHNTITANYTSIYTDYNNWDFTLADNSPAIDAGNIRSTPATDQQGRLRNIDQPDTGCFEKGASLTDREKPSAPSNIQFVAGQTEITLNWDNSSDNTGVSYYKTTIDGNKSYTSITNSLQVTRLDPSQEYDISIVAVDEFGNESEAITTIASTVDEELMTVHFVPAYRHDQLVKSNLKLMWVGMKTLNIGDYDGSSDAAAVIPFQLPCIDSDRSIVSADVMVNLEEIVGTPIGSIDAYLVEMRAKSDVLTTDYYQGSYGIDAIGTPIAESFLSSDSEGMVNMTEEQQVNLGTEIAKLYDSGACNKFAFVRLNSNVENEISNSYYSISSADNLNGLQRPLIKIISSLPSSSKIEEINLGLSIISNPVIDNEIVINKSNIFNVEETLLEIHNSQGQKIYSNIVSKEENIINIKLDISSGVYFVTLLGKNRYAQTKFIKL